MRSSGTSTSPVPLRDLRCAARLDPSEPNSAESRPSWRPALVHPWTVVCHLMADAFGVHTRIAACECALGLARPAERSANDRMRP
jgi:hypothetical protein